MTQPNITTRERCPATFSEQLARCSNVEAAILARLDKLVNQMASIRVQMRAMSVFPSSFPATRLLLTSLSRDQNNTARVLNSRIADRTLPLVPLVNPITGASIPGFPETPASLVALSGMCILYLSLVEHFSNPLVGQELADIFALLNPHINGEDISQAEKKRMLRACIGLFD
jgi:hypothetical protein